MTSPQEDKVFDPNKLSKKPEAPAEKKASGKPAKTTSEKKAQDKADPALDLSITPLKIDDDVPLPENNAGRKTAFNPDRMPFAKLGIGQSFSESMVGGKSADGITTKTVMAQVKKCFPDMTFVVRETFDEFGDLLSARFWRKK